MEKIPSAEQMLKDAYLTIEGGKTVEAHTHLVVQVMNNHTRLHLEAALKAVIKNARITTVGKSDGYECWDVEELDENSILTAYPPEKII